MLQTYWIPDNLFFSYVYRICITNCSSWIFVIGRFISKAALLSPHQCLPQYQHRTHNTVALVLFLQHISWTTRWLLSQSVCFRELKIFWPKVCRPHEHFWDRLHPVSFWILKQNNLVALNWRNQVKMFDFTFGLISKSNFVKAKLSSPVNTTPITHH